MQYREVENRIKRLVPVQEIRDVTFYNNRSIAILGKSVTSSLDHLRI